MTILLARIVPHEQLLVVHAPLGEIEWPGAVEHIKHTILPGVPFILAPTASGKTLLERIEERRRWRMDSHASMTRDDAARMRNTIPCCRRRETAHKWRTTRAWNHKM